MTSYYLVILTSLTLFCFAIAAYFFESNPVLVQSLTITFLVLVCLITGALSVKHSEVANERRKPILNFDLMVDGSVCFSLEDKYFIHPSSRIGFLGCWLQLSKEHSNKIERQSTFVFKNSVSSKSYARLCRAIMRSNFRLNSEAV